MSNGELRRHAFSISVAAALLAGCGGQPLTGASDAIRNED